MHCFITGTDTGVGKTYVTAALLRAWMQAGKTAAGLKPISSGDRADAQQLWVAAAQALTLEEINPLHFVAPISPWRASRAENRVIDLSALTQHITALCSRFTHVAVEGVGGWLTPLSVTETIRDLARRLSWPVLVVVQDRVGTLNHTLLTVESVRGAGLEVMGLVLNRHAQPEATPDHAEALRELTGLPTLTLRANEELALPPWLG